jgi:hypothetical protein
MDPIIKLLLNLAAMTTIRGEVGHDLEAAGVSLIECLSVVGRGPLVAFRKMEVNIMPVVLGEKAEIQVAQMKALQTAMILADRRMKEGILKCMQEVKAEVAPERIIIEAPDTWTSIVHLGLEEEGEPIKTITIDATMTAMEIEGEGMIVEMRETTEAEVVERARCLA